ncbi:MAG TPA: UDP-N-acetylmuramate dehydrogenase [Usitatibacter sp.]|nr:UDP-N-acetylmuramate dehydrogenase [Usitatibacter sp.]
MPPVLRGVLRENEPMSRHVSWRAGGRARTFYQPADVLDLAAFLQTRDAAEPVLFLGLGSNLLVRDGGFAGAVIFTHHALIGIEVESEVATPSGSLKFRAGAGVPSPHLARFVAKHGGAGAEWLAGVPGTVGGALAMNAGCYGGETWNHVVAVETVDRAGRLRHRTAADYELGYRHVAAKNGVEEWFVSAVFGFQPGEERAAMEHIKVLLQKRVATQPLNLPNAGSVFRNPPGDHAARLIESCGLKGFAIGGAEVSAKHANFIVNPGGAATARDIESIIEHVRATVLAKTGVALIPEVRIVGDAA